MQLNVCANFIVCANDYFMPINQLSEELMSVDARWIKILPPVLRRKLDGRANFQAILSNTGWLFADRFIRLAGSVTVGLWMARYLGPTQFGNINFAIAFVSLFAQLASFGLDDIVVRDILHDPAHKHQILGAAAALRFIGGLATVFVAALFIYLLRPNDLATRSFVTILAAGTIFQALDPIDFWFRSRIQSRYTVYARTSAFLIITLVRILLIYTKAPLAGFIWLVSAETGLAAFGLWITYKINGQSLRNWSVSLSCAVGLLKQSWPLMFSGMVIMVYMRIDQVMLGQMMNVKSVGLYSAAVRLSELWYFIPITIVNSVLPTIIQAKKTNVLLYYRKLQVLFNSMSAMAYIVAILVTLFSRRLIEMSYGSGYSESAPILTVHVWTGLFASLGVARGPWIIAEGLTKLGLITTAIGAVVNIILNLLLIPKFGIMGPAIATLLAQFFAAYGVHALLPQTRILFSCQSKAIALTFLFKRVTDIPQSH